MSCVIYCAHGKDNVSGNIFVLAGLHQRFLYIKVCSQANINTIIMASLA